MNSKIKEYERAYRALKAAESALNVEVEARILKCKTRDDFVDLTYELDAVRGFYPGLRRIYEKIENI